jgi:two-component sensor histidine kinase
MSVAAVQRYLDMTDGIDQIEVSNYLTKLCTGLGASMISADQPVELKVTSDTGMIPSSMAVSLGLVVTELVINALKHAFPKPHRHNLISISYSIADQLWTLTVVDNGVGRQVGELPEVGGGLGTNIVAALAKSLHAVVETKDAAPGCRVTISQQQSLTDAKL